MKATMNKYVTLLSAAAVLLFSCTRESDQEVIQPGETITFTAAWAGSEDTRTILQADGTSVWWEPEAQINVFFSDKASGKFTSTNSQAQSIVDFQGSLPIVVGSVETENPPHAYWAVYPYDAANTCDGESVTLTIPSTQTAVEGTFANKMFPSIATSTNFYLAFYNICGGVRFSVANEGIASVTFKANNGESLAGKVQVGFEGAPVVKSVVEGTSEVVVNAPTGGFVPGKYYFAALLPQTLSKGVSLTFKKADGKVASTSLDNSITINRSRFGKMEKKDTGLEFEPNPSDHIVFADLTAKYACVEKFDTNGDGEVSYEEAAAVTSLSGLFTDWNTVTSFEEIRYFTSVTSTVNVFNGLTKLEHITIPDNITTLGNFKGCTALEIVILPASLKTLSSSCFSGCSSLKTVTLPTEITTIPSHAFSNCVALETISLPSTIKSIDYYAFSGCSVLTGIELPSGIQTISNYAFQGCKAISSVDFPATLTSIGQYAYSGCTALTSVTVGSGVSVGEGAFSRCTALGSATIGNGASIGSYAFQECSSLASVVLPGDMTSIPKGCFQNCIKLTTISWPNALATIEASAFSGCRFKDNEYALQLPSSVTTIGSNAFGPLRHLILPSTASISIASDSFTVGYTILYVPASLVEMYKVRTNWSNYATRIRPISDYPAVIAVEAVDLGLSVKWASCNIGAWGSYDFGDYYAWGETEPYYNSQEPLTWKEGKTGYNWASYKWCMGTKTTMIKYCTDSSYGYNRLTDGKTVLDPEDDAAHVNLGNSWRMPTEYELTTLWSECTVTWISQNGVIGVKLTGPNGNSIFLPAAGYRSGTDLISVDTFGGYWSSSLPPTTSSDARSMEFKLSTNIGSKYKSRFIGYSIRPVYAE